MVLAVAGCGGGGQTSSGGATPAVKDLGSAKIVLGGKVITWAPAYIGVCKGFFKDHGLDVEVTVSAQGTTSAIAALVSGEVLSAMTGAPASVAPVREGAPIQMLFNASKGYGVQMFASNDLFKRKNITSSSPLKDRVKALEGEKVGMLNPGDSIDQLLRYTLPKYGLNPDKDITMVALNGYGPMIAATKKGNIASFGASPPYGQSAEQQGLGKILFTGSELPGLDNYPYLVGSANTREISQHPERVKALVAGMADSMKLMRENPDAAKDCIRKEFPDLDQATFDAAYKFSAATIPSSPLITKEAFKSLADFSEASGKPVGVTYEKAVAAGIVKSALGMK
jgi:NitT/TauT family transport system substrate-binding protein